MHQREKKTLSIDFDGTIVDHAFPRIGALKEGVKEALDQLKEFYVIVISSCRTSRLFNRPFSKNPYLDQMRDFLQANGIHYDRIDDGNEGKVVAFAYVDDRAIRFENNWPEITERLMP